MLSTPILDGKHSVFQVFGSVDNYRKVSSFSSSESYDYRGRKVVDPPERKSLNVADPQTVRMITLTDERKHSAFQS